MSTYQKVVDNPFQIEAENHNSFFFNLRISNIMKLKRTISIMNKNINCINFK